MKLISIKPAAVCAAIAWASLAAVATATEPPTAPPSTDIRFAFALPEPAPLPPPDPALDAKRITLSEAEAMALAYHPAMREVEGHVRAARGRWIQAGLPPNPAIGYDGSEIGDEGRGGQQGAFLSQEFVTGGKLGLSQAVAGRETAAIEQRRERVRLQLVTTTRIYYFETLAAEREITLARQLETMGAQAMRASQLRLEAQEGSRASLLQSQVERDTASLLVEQAANRGEAARRRLATLIGSDSARTPSLEDKLDDPLPSLDWETAKSRLLSESPELAELRAQVERAKWAVQRANAGRVPNVNLESGVQYDNATNDTIANVQLSVPLPLFDRNQGNISAACGELSAAQSALENRELALTERLATAIRDYHTASHRVAKYNDSILPAARQSRDLVAQAYDQGELDYLQLLTTQQTYTSKNLAYLQDLVTAWKQWAEIDGLLVGPLADRSN